MIDAVFRPRAGRGNSARSRKNESIMRIIRDPQRQGMALVWVALVGIVFVVFLALAADTARVYLARHQLQNGADAAALAGVYRVRNDAPLAHDTARATAN